METSVRAPATGARPPRGANVTVPLIVVFVGAALM